MPKPSMLLAAGALCAGALPAFAAFEGGALCTTCCSGEVFAEFYASDAGATGSVYFLGAQAGDEPITYATSTDANGLGKFLFSNHGAQPGASVSLGVFDAGVTMHFAYLITSGVPVAPTRQITRSDDEGVLYFTMHEGEDEAGEFCRVGIEDVQGEESDWDFNDVEFNLRCSCRTDVPAPGAAGLALLGLAAMAPRRR